MSAFTLPQKCSPPSLHQVILLLPLRWRDPTTATKCFSKRQVEGGRDFWSKYLEMNDRFRQIDAYWCRNSNEVPDSSWNLDYSKFTKRKGNIDILLTDLTAPCTLYFDCFSVFSNILGVSISTVKAIRILFWHLN